MPRLDISYTGLIRSVVGLHVDSIEMNQGATLRDVLLEVVRRHGVEASRFLFDDDGRLLPHSIILVNDHSVRKLEQVLCKEDDNIKIVVMGPMMTGG